MDGKRVKGVYLSGLTSREGESCIVVHRQAMPEVGSIQMCSSIDGPSVETEAVLVPYL